MFLEHIHREDQDLFWTVAYSDPENPTQEEVAAFDELVKRGYTPTFIISELRHHWETREVGL